MTKLSSMKTEKTIKKRLETEGLFVESRAQNEDLHLFVGKKDGSGNKAHIVIDGKMGEIRVDDKDQAPEEVVSKIETVLTLKSGKKIKSTREALEELQENNDNKNIEQHSHSESSDKRLHLGRKFKGIYCLGELYNFSSEDISDLNITLDFVDENGNHKILDGRVINHFDEPLRATPSNPTIIRQGDTLHIVNFPRADVDVVVTGKLLRSQKEFRQQFNIQAHRS